MPAIIIVEYDPSWPMRYEEEKARILAVAGDAIEELQHIGSTSVPGLGAKPTIDIMIGLRELSYVEVCIQPLQSLGYEYLEESGIPERHFFRKPHGAAWVGRMVNVHMVVKGGDFWVKHLLFRDYLRGHPETAQQYYILKKELTNRLTADPSVSDRAVYDGYGDGKGPFIEEIVRRAAGR